MNENEPEGMHGKKTLCNGEKLKNSLQVDNAHGNVTAHTFENSIIQCSPFSNGHFDMDIINCPSPQSVKKLLSLGLISSLFDAQIDGFEMDSVQTAQEAAATIKNNTNVYSAVILFADSKAADCFNFLLMRAKSPLLLSVPVIMLSDSQDHEAELKALKLFACDFIAMPVDRRILNQRIQNLIVQNNLRITAKIAESIINNLPGGIEMYEIGEEIRLMFFGEGMSYISGYARSEYSDILLKDPFAFVHPDDRELIIREVKDSAKFKRQFLLEYRNINKDGSVRYTKASGKYAFQNGENAVYYVMLSDVTSEKHTRDSLMDMQLRYKEAFAQSSLYMFELDITNGCLRLINEQSAHFGEHGVISGMPEALSSTELLHPESVNDAIEMYNKVTSGEPLVSSYLKIKSEDGSYRFFNIMLTTVFSKGGVVLSAIGVAQDKNAEMEQKLRYEREISYRRSLTKNSLAFFEYNISTGRLLDVYERLDPSYHIGSVNGELGYDVLTSLIHPDDTHIVEPILHSDISSDASQSGGVMAEIRMLSPSKDYEDYHYVSITVSYMTDPTNGENHALINIRDIDERKKKELEMLDLARHDSLTGLFNRRSYEGLVKKRLADANDEKCAFMIIDVDDFKHINDTLGHMYGDSVLSLIGKTLKGLFRGDDFLARMGGDEFSVFMKNVPHKEIAFRKGSEISNSLEKYVETVKGMLLSCSVGIAMYPDDGTTFSQLYEHADIALYYAKKRGKSRCCLYNGDMSCEKSGEWISRDWLVDIIDDVIFVSDVSTHETLYINKAGRMLLRDPNRAYKTNCHELLMGKGEPCAFCDTSRLSFNEFSVRRFKNKYLGRDFILKDKLVNWEGHAARMQIMVDVTDCSSTCTDIAPAKKLSDK